MPHLELLPAVDVMGGKAVRLVQGEAGSQTEYGDDPVQVALDWQSQGAEWIHLVDLDAAFGKGVNTELLAEVVRQVTATPKAATPTGKGAVAPGPLLGTRVEISGGIRDDVSLKRALSSGATRVNLGTAALENPEWTEKVIKEYGDQIAVGLDVRGTTLAARGWVKEGGDLWETLDRLNRAGCARYVVTDVTKDGTLQGPNLELLKQVAARTDAPVVASGGISNLQDIAALTELVPIGIEGAIVGKALYAGAFTLPEALRLANQ